ncbi:MAG: hypothetical protein J4F29_11510 [Candidatus Latescibacteria bacterium]|nr:hypothetical protein [Candidatus Latescibacterota bacterium]
MFAVETLSSVGIGRHILDALEATKYRIKGPRGAAKRLGVPPSTLYGKINRLGIKLS